LHYRTLLVTIAYFLVAINFGNLKINYFLIYINQDILYMWELIVQILVSALAFFVGAQLLKGIKIEGFGHAITIAIIIALLNGTLGEVLEWITPDKTLNFLTLGLFQFILDAIVIWVGGKVMNRFHVESFGYAILLAVIVAVVCSVTHGLIG
jgi:putative membrane protein